MELLKYYYKKYKEILSINKLDLELDILGTLKHNSISLSLKQFIITEYNNSVSVINKINNTETFIDLNVYQKYNKEIQIKLELFKEDK